MARHLEFVFGPIGEEIRLPCACSRESNHLRPTSASLLGVAGREAGSVSDPEPRLRSPQLRPRRREQHRTRFPFPATHRARHAA